jgi:hypothetical protein
MASLLVAIGFIAGAGIVVRNSIIFVDFIEMRRRQGVPLDEAVIDAGAVRFRPMALTAAPVAVGSAVILFDPMCPCRPDASPCTPCHAGHATRSRTPSSAGAAAAAGNETAASLSVRS